MGKPRYQVLADHLVEQISSGELSVGARVPSEHELCEQHQMSRGTVREALRCLEDLGMISRTRLGTTVVAQLPVDAYHPSAGSPDEIMDLVRRTKLRHPMTSEVVADEVLARRLDVAVGSIWFVMVGPLVLRADPGVTLCWSEHYHATSEIRDTFRRGAYEVASPKGTRLEQVISADTLAPEIAEALGTAPGAPALIVRRRHIGPEGKVYKASVHTHRGDRFRITTTFEDPETSL